MSRRPDDPAELPASSTPHVAAPARWWSTFFDERYAGIGFRPRDAGEPDAIAAFLERHLRLHEGARVFDQCCGRGRVSIPLARRGVTVHGVDQSVPYVEHAAERAEAEGLDATYTVGDALEHRAPTLCDAGFNWYTSFGYHVDDAVNVRMLDRAFESIRPGGRFALDYVSVPFVLANFRSAHVIRPEGSDGPLVIDEPRADFRSGTIESTWTFVDAEGRRETRRIRTRLYLPHELTALFERAGFEVLDLLGDLDGSAFDLRSRRLIVIGRRPD